MGEARGQGEDGEGCENQRGPREGLRGPGVSGIYGDVERYIWI